jgi:hypothetical protein
MSLEAKVTLAQKLDSDEWKLRVSLYHGGRCLDERGMLCPSKQSAEAAADQARAALATLGIITRDATSRP